MFGFTAVTVMQVALWTAAGGDYQAAYDRAEAEGKPFLILIGTDWCPGCRVMKQENIPELKREGDLQEVVYAEVDADAKPELSRRLLRGNSIPQLVLYMRIGKRWRRTQLTGVHSPEDVRGFLRRQIAAGHVEAKDAETETISSQSSNAELHPVSAQR